MRVDQATGAIHDTEFKVAYGVPQSSWPNTSLFQAAMEQSAHTVDPGLLLWKDPWQKGRSTDQPWSHKETDPVLIQQSSARGLKGMRQRFRPRAFEVQTAISPDLQSSTAEETGHQAGVTVTEVPPL